MSSNAAALRGTGVAIAAAARTPIGSYGKSLRDVPASELGALAAREAIERSGLAADQIEHVIFGNVIHTGREDMYMGRVVGMKAGVPKETPALTVNRLCGSGVQAIVSAAHAIQVGDADTALAGGAESMSRGPYWAPAARWGMRMGEAAMIDPVMGVLQDPFYDILMGVTAENLAEQMRITREEQDAFAVQSHQRMAAAQAAGRFDEQLVSVPVPAKRGEVRFERDEHVRPEVSIEALAKLPPVFKSEGTVTAATRQA